MTDQVSVFAGVAMALYAAHHVGDYWVQTDAQARHKGEAGAAGRSACSAHVVTYVVTQAMFLLALVLVTGTALDLGKVAVALLISGVTHWMADRREHGLLFWLAHRLPGKRDFLAFDRGRLASGAWALDQSWHIFWGVFVTALVIAS